MIIAEQIGARTRQIHTFFIYFFKLQITVPLQSPLKKIPSID